MTRTVATVEIPLYERMVPLLGGYLEAYASKDPVLKRAYQFVKFTATPRSDRDELIKRLIALDADVYALSCYVWNMGLIKYILPRLLSARPSAQVMLGGPQVMHNAPRYLNPDWERVAICNGEGEITFSDYLNEVAEPKPDLSRVKGISFTRDREIVTTVPQQRIATMDEIPSPFLSGVFRDSYTITIIETNRGCPFHCGFCYWGAATNDRVFKFDEQRVKDEFTWISRSGILFLYIADANWGMLKRDIELSRHLAHCKTRYDAPKSIYYSAAKNVPEHVTEITGILSAAGITSAQPISLQTSSDESLRIIDRQNIKRSSYLKIQENLKERQLGSYTELIWPLPGETPHSFREGVAQLCRSSSGTVLVYPHLLLNNTPLFKKRVELGLVTTPVDDGVGEAELVTQTPTVPQQAMFDGLRFFYAVYLLRNARALRSVADYLDRNSILKYEDFFDAFASYCQTIINCPVAQFIESSVETLGCYDVFNYGKLAHYALHQYRSECNALMNGFLLTLDCWNEEPLRFLAEVDRVTRPYIYSSTPVNLGADTFEILQVVAHSAKVFDITVPVRFQSLFAEAFRISGVARHPETRRYRIDHCRSQYPYMPSQGIEHNAVYCYSQVVNVHEITPSCVPITH